MTDQDKQISNSRPIPWRLRKDVQWHGGFDGDRTNWVAVDPFKRKLYRFGDQERKLLGWIDGRNSICDIQNQFAIRFSPQTIAADELNRLLRAVIAMGLVIGTSNPSRDRQSSKAQNAIIKLLNWLIGLPWKLLFTKFSLVNPNRILQRIANRFDWLFSRAAVQFWITCIVVSLGLILTRLPDVMAQWPSWNQLRSPQLWIGLGVVFVITRLVHELGHGLACVRLGASCVDFGVMMMMGVASPYVDVTDSWRLSNRWHRAAIAAAGIYVELVMASLAAIWWWSTHDGWLHDISWQIMLVCTISTLVFNANPLMRYDGYFILCDLSNSPNFREKSIRALQETIGRIAFGKGTVDRIQPLSARMLCSIVFGILVQVYRLALTIGIAYGVITLLNVWNLRWLGFVLAIGVLTSTFITPLIRAGKWTIYSIKRSRTSLVRSAFVWGIVIVMILCIMLVPFPQRLSCEGVVEPKNQLPVYALVAGRLMASHSRNDISKDECLFQLEESDLQLSKDLLDIKLKGFESQLYILEHSDQRDVDKSQKSDWKCKLENDRTTAQGQLAEIKTQQQSLRVLAPSDGEFISSFAHSIVTHDEQESKTINKHRMPWNATEAIGRFVPKNTTLGWVVTGSEKYINAKVNQIQLRSVVRGMSANIRFRQQPWKVFQAVVEDVSIETDDKSKIPGNQEPSARPTPLSTGKDYFVKLALSEIPDGKLIPGGRVDVVICSNSRTLSAHLTDYISRTFR